MGPKNLCARVCVGVCMHVFSIWNDYYDLVDLGGTTFNYEYSCVYLFLSEFSFLYYLCTFLYFEKYLLIYYNSRWWKYSSELNTHTHTHKNTDIVLPSRTWHSNGDKDNIEWHIHFLLRCLVLISAVKKKELITCLRVRQGVEWLFL